MSEQIINRVSKLIDGLREQNIFLNQIIKSMLKTTEREKAIVLDNPSFRNTVAKAHEQRQLIVKDEYLELMKIGLDSLGVSDTTSLEDRLKMSEQVRQTKIAIEELSGSDVREQFGVEKKMIIRYLSATKTGLNQYEAYTDELKKIGRE